MFYMNLKCRYNSIITQRLIFLFLLQNNISKLSIKPTKLQITCLRKSLLPSSATRGFVQHVGDFSDEVAVSCVSNLIRHVSRYSLTSFCN